MHDVILEIKNISKRFIDKKHIIDALSDVSISIFRGEILGLLGVNGAGKTTLSSIIATLHPPTSGDILYNGSSIYTHMYEFRKNLGFCPQRPNFDRLLSVRDNLIFAGRYFLMPEDLIHERVKLLMEQFELTRYASSSALILSGGYKQRLILARSMMHNPTVLILDEPTVALDPHIRRQLWDIILNLKKMGVTIILTTHYIDEAEILSDRVCILDKGRVRLIDKPSNLMSTYSKTRLEDVFLQLTQD
ncbi:MAG: ABC transporter ATP-binding protein [Candidatus Babeliaceae bacterium]|jgi:ABC-2 type transport system ATP-binding protein